jgi:hypothetical protein
MLFINELFDFIWAYFKQDLSFLKVFLGKRGEISCIIPLKACLTKKENFGV